MQVEVGADGWRVTGKTWEHRDQLKALGGRWNAEDKAWLLPASADVGELGALLVEATPPPHSALHAAERAALEDLGVADALHACDATFSGNTYGARELLKRLGARYDGASKRWRLEGSFNRRALERALDAAQLEWRWYRPYWQRRDARRDVLVVELAYDAERHGRLSSGCSCAPTQTCAACRYACCAAARPWTDTELAERWLSGAAYDCPQHGRVEYICDE